MQSKKKSRLRRARRTRARILGQNKARLCIYRTPRHIYAQIIGPEGNVVLASASAVDSVTRAAVKNTGNSDAAIAVGKSIAERATVAGIKRVAFDRSGFAYHGRVKALADAAREGGLEF